MDQQNSDSDIIRCSRKEILNNLGIPYSTRSLNWLKSLLTPLSKLTVHRESKNKKDLTWMVGVLFSDIKFKAKNGNIQLLEFEINRKVFSSIFSKEMFLPFDLFKNYYDSSNFGEKRTTYFWPLLGAIVGSIYMLELRVYTGVIPLKKNNMLNKTEKIIESFLVEQKLLPPGSRAIRVKDKLSTSITIETPLDGSKGGLILYQI